MTMQPDNSIQFVSLGPGDPEMVTLGALHALQRADIILAPGNKETSRAADIVRSLGITTPIEVFHIPMSTNRQAALDAYAELADLAKQAIEQDKRVAVCVEGDASVYASMHYVMDLLAAEGYPATQLPGIPSFIAAAAVANMHLASGNQRLVVVPGNLTPTDTEHYLADNCVVVVMKLSACIDALHTVMAQHPDWQYAYYENVGLPTSFFSQRIEDIVARQPTYFSMLIIRR
uniref:Cobalt-precorrin-2 C(20)-methyltransferase n=1 Tax=Prevotella sp. GTC17260 TaxID=3236796 RepID=A0AB33JE39_9BACT